MSIYSVSSAGGTSCRADASNHSIIDDDAPPGIEQHEWDDATREERLELIQESIRMESQCGDLLRQAAYTPERTTDNRGTVFHAHPMPGQNGTPDERLLSPNHPASANDPDESWAYQDSSGAVHVFAYRDPQNNEKLPLAALAPHPAQFEQEHGETQDNADDVYRIRPGDTWGSIARAHGMTTKELDDANQGKFKDKNKIVAGERLSVKGYKKKPEPVPPPSRPADAPIGWLAAQYESGQKGILAVGWDKKGKTSYGTYQINTITMPEFLVFVKDKNQTIYEELNPLKNKIDGGAKGEFARAWRNLASSIEHGAELAKHEYAFIETKYNTALQQIQSTELKNQVEASIALQEVVWSMAVQHGANTGILNAVFKKGMAGDSFIRAVYERRGIDFSSSTLQVRTGVKSRLADEAEHALYLYAQEKAKAAEKIEGQK